MVKPTVEVEVSFSEKTTLFLDELKEILCRLENIRGKGTKYYGTGYPSEGVAMIARERERQITEEGYDSRHDDRHNKDDSLARAAAHYAAPGEAFLRKPGGVHNMLNMWPATWNERFNKKSSHSRNTQLIIAGALIAAELDRLSRSGEEE